MPKYLVQRIILYGKQNNAWNTEDKGSALTEKAFTKFNQANMFIQVAIKIQSTIILVITMKQKIGKFDLKNWKENMKERDQWNKKRKETQDKLKVQQTAAAQSNANINNGNLKMKHHIPSNKVIVMELIIML